MYAVYVNHWCAREEPFFFCFFITCQNSFSAPVQQKLTITDGDCFKNVTSVLLGHVPLAPWRLFSTFSSSKLVRSQLCFRHICRLFQCSRKHAATRRHTEQNHWKTSQTVYRRHIITVSHTQHTTLPLATTILPCSKICQGFMVNFNSQVSELFTVYTYPTKTWILQRAQ